MDPQLISRIIEQRRKSRSRNAIYNPQSPSEVMRIMKNKTPVIGIVLPDKEKDLPLPENIKIILDDMYSKMTSEEMREFILNQEKMIQYGKIKLSQQEEEEETEEEYPICEKCGDRHQDLAQRDFFDKVLLDFDFFISNHKKQELTAQKDTFYTGVVVSDPFDHEIHFTDPFEGDSLPWPKVSRDELDSDLEEMVNARNEYLRLRNRLDF